MSWCFFCSGRRWMLERNCKWAKEQWPSSRRPNESAWQLRGNRWCRFSASQLEFRRQRKREWEDNWSGDRRRNMRSIHITHITHTLQITQWSKRLQIGTLVVSAGLVCSLAMLTSLPALHCSLCSRAPLSSLACSFLSSRDRDTFLSDFHCAIIGLICCDGR